MLYYNDDANFTKCLLNKLTISILGNISGVEFLDNLFPFCHIEVQWTFALLALFSSSAATLSECWVCVTEFSKFLRLLWATSRSQSLRIWFSMVFCKFVSLPSLAIFLVYINVTKYATVSSCALILHFWELLLWWELYFPLNVTSKKVACFYFFVS